MSRASVSPPRPLEEMNYQQLLESHRQANLEREQVEERANQAEKRAALADTTNVTRGRPRRGRPPRPIKRARNRRVVASDDDEPAEFEEQEQSAGEADDGDEDEDEGEQARQAGIKYGLVKGMWMAAGSAEKTMKVKLTASFDEKHRFESHTLRVQGELRDVIDVLPDALHDLRSKGFIMKKFNLAFNNQRSNSVTRLRGGSCARLWNHHLAKHLENSDGQKFDASEIPDGAVRAKWAHFIGGKANAAKKMEYSLFDAPVLHGDFYDQGFKPETFLNSKLLMHVTTALLFGPAKANFMATGKGTVPSNTTMDVIHGITHTTPGLVANAAIYTMWTLSADTQLRTPGSETGINWRKEHEQLLEYLLRGLREKRKPVVELFRDWDAELFPDSETSLGHPGPRQDGASEGDGRSRAMAAMDAMAVVEDEEEQVEATGDL